MLAYYTWHPELVKRNGNLHWFPFFVGRVLRTTPMIAGTVLLILAFPPNWGAGPLFMKGYNNVTTNCLNNWWTELTYLSNFNEAGDSVSRTRQGRT